MNDIQAARAWLNSDAIMPFEHRMFLLRALDALEREESSDADDHADYEASAVVRVQATLAKVMAERDRLAAQVAKMHDLMDACDEFEELPEEAANMLLDLHRILDGEVG